MPARALPLALVVVLAACAAGGSSTCAAADTLSAIDARFIDGDIASALSDRDLEALAEALDAVATDASAVRDDLEGSDAAGAAELSDAASGFIRGANLLKATFTAATIRQDDLDAGLDEIDAARSALEDADGVLEGCE